MLYFTTEYSASGTLPLALYIIYYSYCQMLKWQFNNYDAAQLVLIHFLNH